MVCGTRCAETVAADVARELPHLRVRLLDGQTALARFLEASERRLVLMSNKVCEWLQKGGAVRWRELPGLDPKHVQ